MRGEGKVIEAGVTTVVVPASIKRSHWRVMGDTAENRGLSDTDSIYCRYYRYLTGVLQHQRCVKKGETGRGAKAEHAAGCCTG